MKRLIAAVLICLCLPVGAHAYIVNTGTPDESVPWVAGGGDFGQSLSSQFTITQWSTITSIEGYFDDVYATPGNITVSLYSGSSFDAVLNGPIPDVSTSIFSGSISIGNAVHTDFSYGGWYGVSGLNLSLNPGSYWIAFGDPADTYSGAMPGVAPNPLTPAAWAQPGYNGGGYNYFDPALNGSDMGIGVRVDGRVPEPLSLILLGIGVAGVIGVRRFQK